MTDKFNSLSKSDTRSKCILFKLVALRVFDAIFSIGNSDLLTTHNTFELQYF